MIDLLDIVVTMGLMCLIVTMYVINVNNKEN